MKKKSNVENGSNDSCPCGSGLEYKECHGNVSGKKISSTVNSVPFSTLPKAVQDQIISYKKKKAKQGKVRPIISLDHQGHKFIAVGGRLHYSKSWKTFHDFLIDYIKDVLGSEWCNSELKKNLPQRHPIIQWCNSVDTFLKKNIKKEGDVYSAVCTGVVGAYLSLAYDLYILRHHSLLQSRLIERLKNIGQFQGARYEIYTTASFIKAGFEIEFEDETDRSSTHCEFVATHKKFKRKYSVEAKSRHRSGFLGHIGGPVKELDAIRLQIGNLVNNALKKKADHTRIIFIDINMPPREGSIFEKNWFDQLGKTLTKIERDGVDGKPCPPAYTYFTNHPYHYVGENEIEPSRDFIFSAVNIPAMLEDSDLSEAAKQEPPIFKLWDSINMHAEVPHEF